LLPAKNVFRVKASVIDEKRIYKIAIPNEAFIAFDVMDLSLLKRKVLKC
jgi:hypothetical protein